METPTQNSSESFSYLLFASGMVLVVIVASSSIFSARAGSPKEARAPLSNAAAGQAQVAASQTPRARPIADFESELITIGRRGFEPREITIPARRFLLILENRSGLRAIVLQLKKEDGEVIREARLTREESDWSSLLTLLPGRYLLTEASHPRWSCTLTITQ